MFDFIEIAWVQAALSALLQCVNFNAYFFFLSAIAQMENELHFQVLDYLSTLLHMYVSQ